MMTSRDVVDHLLRGKKAERVGLMDGPWSDTIAAWVRQGYPTRVRLSAMASASAGSLSTISTRIFWAAATFTSGMPSIIQKKGSGRTFGASVSGRIGT